MSTQHVNTTGTGAGSCAAFPFRADSLDLDHVGGCPRWAECCTEFGYCHGKVDNGHNKYKIPVRDRNKAYNRLGFY